MNTARLLLVLGMGVLFLACRQGTPEPPRGQSGDPLLDQLRPPPLNRPVRPEPVRADAPTLPADNVPAITVAANGALFQGSAQVNGRITLSAGRLRAIGAGKESFDVAYRLPEGLTPPQPFDGDGELVITEQSTPSGPERRILLRSNGSTLFGYAAAKSSAPAEADYGGVRLVQRPISPDESASPVLAVPVDAVVDGKVVARGRVGAGIRIPVTGGMVEIWVDASRRVLAGPRDQHPGGYILEAWVVRVK